MLRVPIRLKLGGALATPLLVLFAVTTVKVVGAAQEVRNIREQTDLAEAAVGPSGAITELQNERRWSVVELVGGQGGSDGGATSYEEVRAQTDQALTQLREEIGNKGGAVSAAFEPAFDDLVAVDEVRADIDGSTTPHTAQDNLPFSQAVFDRFSALIESLFDATTRVSGAVNDTELRRGAELADIAARQNETIAVLVIDLYVAGSSPGGVDTAPEIANLATLQATFERYAVAMRTAEGPFSAIAADHYPAELTNQLNDVVDRAIATKQVDATALSAALDSPAGGNYTDYQEAIADAITRRADELNTVATSRQRWSAILTLLTLVLATATAWAVSRSITRPLRSLTRQATDVARRGLPDAVAGVLASPLGQNVDMPNVAPVQVDSSDEVSDLVDALNTVQEAALDLAVEQAILRRNIADSFVNLGRRNQNLLGRQLDFITQLESNETEPDVLSNLFRLDHLATRMRRNAESLLVLAGVEPSRGWVAPVRITDVVRAALGEVEDYQRVSLRDIEPATVLGFAAADLAHLLAELIENALVFSGPDRTVDVRGRHRTDHAPGAPDGTYYALAVIDSGLGMTATDVTTANRRLAGVEMFTVAPSKYLGHYVAGQLAARHGIGIQLDNPPGNGITATVWLPASVFAIDARPMPALTPPDGVPAIGTPAPVADRRGGGPARGRVSPATWPSGSVTLGDGWPPQRPGPARVGPSPSSPSTTAASPLQCSSGLPGTGRLARRVPGAHIPDTQVRPVHRSTVVRPATAARTPVDEAAAPNLQAAVRSAEEVYGFLSSFTAGVQKRLEHARDESLGRRAPGSHGS